MAPLVSQALVKRFGAMVMVVNIAVAFFSITDMYLLASGAVRVDIPQEDDFETSFDPFSLELVFRSKFKVMNRGFYDIEGLDIRSTLLTEDGAVLINYDNTNLKVGRFSSETFSIEARLPMDRLLSVDTVGLLFDDTSFRLRVSIDADYVLGLVHFDLDQDRTYPWDPPLADHRNLIENGTLSAIVDDLLEGDFAGAADGIEALLLGALMAAGGEVEVAIGDYAVLTAAYDGDVLHLKLMSASSPRIAILHVEIPLWDWEGDGDDAGEVDGDLEVDGGGTGDG